MSNSIPSNVRAGLELDTDGLARLIYGISTPATRRRIRREFDKDPEDRLPGIYKRGSRVHGIEEVVREGLLRRARGRTAPPPEQVIPPRRC